MADDPYAKYLTPPDAPAAAPAASPAASSGDPYEKYLTPPGAAPAASGAPSDTDYSNSPWAARLRTLAESGGLGAGDLILSHLAGTSLAGEQAKTQAAAASLPWWQRYPIEAGGYGLGAGLLMSGIPEAAGIGGLGALAAEGALAGTTSAAIHSGGDMSLGNLAPSALGGAALGGAAGLIPKGINATLTKTLSKPGMVDPAGASAKTAQDTADAYAALHQQPANPVHIDRAIGGVMNNLDPSVETGMSPGLNKTINDIRSTVQGLPDANMGQVDSWQRQINAAAQRERYPTDKVVASQIDNALDGVIQQGGAGSLQDDAQAAFRKSQNAQMLQDLQNQQQYFNKGPGAGPQNIASKYYSPGDPEHQAAVDISQAQQSGYDPSFVLSHTGGAIGAGLGASLAGPVGAMVGHPLGQMATKMLTKNFTTGRQASRLAQAYQNAYPAWTGVQPTGAVQAPQLGQRAGDLIKNLMLGGAY